jgi:tetratricopeptide (TPR) repeat protein/O-antigen ligase
VCRRNPAQTLFALAVYFICRWHFVLCDTRGGTISMTVGILLTTWVVARYHGQRFRLLMYLVLLEPLMWAALNTASLDYQDTQTWGRILNAGPARREIIDALTNALKGTEAASLRSYILQFFLKGNEFYLGIPLRLPAMLLGVALALFIFWLLVTRLKDWRIHLVSAALLAFMPYWFAVQGTFPGAVSSTTAALMVSQGVAASEVSHKDFAVQAMDQYGLVMVKAAGNYNRMILNKHQDVAAKFALSLFMCMAVFLLFRWYDREDGWLPGFAVAGSIFLWLVVYLALRSGGGPFERMWTGLTKPLDHAWPIELERATAKSTLICLLFNPLSFAALSLLSIAGSIAAMQWIPHTWSKEDSLRLVAKTRFAGKVAVPVVALAFLVWVAFQPSLHRVLHAVGQHYQEGVVRSVFYAAHAFFNTQGEFQDEPPDNPVGFRLEIYQGTLRKMLDNPILGVGPGNFKVINPHPKYETALERRILGKEVLGRHPHNDFLEAATDRGSIGLLGFIWVFGVGFLILLRAIKLVHPPRDGSDVFVNTVTWGLFWAIAAIVVHAQFEMPLLQPASTYPAWFLLGISYQVWRVQRRRVLAAKLDSPLLLSAQSPGQVAEAVLSGRDMPSAAVYELPPAPERCDWGVKSIPAWVAWPLVGVVVTVLTGSVLMRQFAGEMWLRWGMIFSESGVERYDYVFDCMEKSSDIYPQEMETNYILGRYCIDATSKVYRPWLIKHSPDLYSKAEQEQAERDAAEIRKNYHLDVEKIIDYAELGVRVHKRDVFMNPSYKWAHNNMGVLYDKLTQIYETLSVHETDPRKKADYSRRSHECETNSRNCYHTALEIDDLQVYALYNLGHGAYRDYKRSSKDPDLERARKYFERTLLADPNRRDVNFFIAQTRLALNDLPGGVEALQDLMAWRDAGYRVEADQVEDTEMMLHQTTRAALSLGDNETACQAAKILANSFDRCRYLPLQAHAVVNSGSVTQAIELVNESLSKCGNRISADSIFAQAKAYALVGNITASVSAFQTLMKSEAGAHFKEEIKRDPAFEFLRDKDVYKTLMKDKEAAKAVTSPATSPAPAPPETSSATQ